MLELKNVNFGYDKDLIISDYSMVVNSGERVAIKGKSGSGKSTILRLIAGLEDLKDGSIFLDKENITNLPTFNRNIGYVFQGFALFPHLTVKKNILFGINHLKKKDQKKQLNELVELFQIEDLLDRYPHEISGGQKQRVAIARSLITNPKILLLDEPFSALDQDLKSSIRQDLLELFSKLDITIILVTHDIEDAEILCNRIIDINKSII